MPSEALQYVKTHRARLVIVVGGGAVGIYLATQLARQQVPVLLIEKGGEGMTYFTDREFSVTGRPHGGVSNGRVQGLGGTTSLWGGQLVEFTEKDFSHRTHVPNWPMTLAELKPHYAAVYEHLGYLPEDQSDPVVLARLTEPPSDMGDTEIFLTRWLAQPHFARHFANALDADEIRYLMHATVTGLRFAGARCSGVNVSLSGADTVFLPAAQVVVAAGTLESVRLLQNVAVHQPECPWRDSAMLGRYFQDHLAARVAELVPSGKHVVKRFSTIVQGRHRFQPKLRLKQTGNDLNVCGFFAFDSSVSEQVAMLKQFLKALMTGARHDVLSLNLGKLLSTLQHVVPLVWAYLRHSRIYVPGDSHISLSIQSEVEPLWHQALSLDHSRVDEHGLHPLRMDWQLSGKEWPAIMDFVQCIARDLQAAGLGTLAIAPALQDTAESSAAWLSQHATDTYHQAGGAIMGACPDSSFVDANLRIHGAVNVYVCGASTFPRSGYANTTLTALAFAHRLANHLGTRA